MYFVDNSSGVKVMPTPGAVFSTDPLWFTQGDSTTSPTYPGPDWFNIVQAEMMNVLSAAGIALKKDDNTQLSQAITAIINSKIVAPPVTSVNGKTGEVSLTAADVHALPDTYTAPVSSVNGKTGAVTLAASDVGALPDTYTPPAAPVSSVNGKTGAVTLAASDVGALPDTYTAPVSSVNGKTGAVSLTASDVGALPSTYTPDLSAYLTTSTANSTYQKINTASKASNGWFKDSNTGVLYQWGKLGSSSDVTVTFPIVFPAAVVSVVTTCINDGAAGNASTVQNLTNTSFTLHAAGHDNYWIAIGY
ncbi:gp53-like domain-containing protein [Salmonella enterica subsp. enterica]